jgi:chorismate synthase
VAAGAVARRFLEELGVRIIGHIPQIGSIKAAPPELDYQWIASRVEDSPFRTTDPEIVESWKELVDQSRRKGDTVGGLYEVIAFGVPPGLGSYSQWDRRLDGILAQAFMSINATKGVEIGAGFETASLPGSVAHDELYRDEEQGLHRKTNRAGGIEGGISTGDPIILRAAMKPLSTLMRPLSSVNLRTNEAAIAHAERSDVCAVPAAAIVGEAVLALELAESVLEKFGGDSLEETKRNLGGYLEAIERHTGWVHGHRQVYPEPAAGP